MSDIPEARECLKVIADSLEAGTKSPKDAAEYIRKIVNTYMVRAPSVRRTRPRSQPITPEVVRAVRAKANNEPTWSLQQIANCFNINVARVSEILNGVRWN